MSILDTFYILFKSNADDAVKGNQRYEKSNKELEHSLKDVSDQSDKVGHNFVKMAESAAGAIGAISGFEILKSGVQNAIDLNTQLKTVAENYGTTAEKLRTAGLAAQFAGGSVQGGIADALTMARANIAVRQPAGDPTDNLRRLRSRISGFDQAQKLQFLQQFGITDQGDIRRLTQLSDKEFEADIKRAQRLSAGTNTAADKAYAANKSEVQLSGESQSFFNRLLTAISTPLNSILGIISAAIGNTGPAAGSAAVIGGSTLAGLGVLKVVKGLLGKGSVGAAAGAGEGITAGEAVAGVAALGLADAAATGLAIGAGIAGIGYGAYKLFGIYQKSVNDFGARFQRKPLAQSLRNNSGNPDLDFWMAQGYTKDQAAGIVANMQAESGGKAGAVGDGGAAHGLFQWHEKRRQAIIKATGIDINTASHSDQLRAAAWEMKNGNTGFNDSHFRSLTGADNAGAYFATNFEHPANALAKSITRGKNALAIASQLSPASGGTINVKIDKIDIVTAATDANAIATGISGALENKIYTALGFLASNVDNGQSR